jgi:hypothetical protein
LRLRSFRRCGVCGAHGHTDPRCAVFDLNQSQERQLKQRIDNISLGLTPELEAQIARIRAAWRVGLATALVVLSMVVSAVAGTISGQIQTPTGGVLKNGTLGFKLSQPAVLSGTAIISTAQSFCYTSNLGAIVGLPDPLTLPVVSTNTLSGTLVAGTYYTVITYYGAGGETVASPETSTVLSATGTLIISGPVLQPGSATGYKVYIGATPGSETLQGTVTGFGQYQQTSALAAGAALPASNTTVCSVAFSDTLIPTGTYYTVSLVNKNGSMIAGFPQTWCTFGGLAGTINVSNGAPTGNCGTNGVFYPTPIFANPQNNAPQSISGPVAFPGGIFGDTIFSGNETFSGNNTHSGAESFAKFNNIIYVDGVTYPLTAAGIQAAVNAACNGSTLGAVVIPPGSISLGTTGVSVPNNCDVGGVGLATKLSFTSGAATTHFINTALSPSNIRFHDLTLDGGSGTSTSEGCIGMNAVTAPQDITIERVTCQNVGASGFNITGTAANPGSRIKVLHSKILNAGLATGAVGQLYGILVSFNSHVLVLDNEIGNGGLTTGIAAFSSINASSATPIEDVQIISNRIHDLTYTTTTGGAIDVGRARQAAVANNIVWNLQQGGCVTLESIWGGAISGNVCSVADTVLTGGPILVKIPDSTQTGEVASQDIAITGNTILDKSLVASTNAGITVNGAARNIAITGNAVSYLNQPSSGAYGIYLQLGTADANIAAASQNFCNVFTVTGNTIVGRAGASGAVLNGIGIQQVATACIVDQVTVDNNTINGANNGIAIGSASASDGITHLYVHDNPVEGNTVGLSTDGKTYASFFYWNNNPPNGAGLQLNNLPPVTSKFNAGISNDGPGFKHKRVTGCTTGAVSGNNCETTVTWTTAFADANYTPVCTLLGAATLGHLGAISTSAIAAASVKVQTVTDTAAAITGTINCIAVHD